jgi:hypothetical protein
MKTKNIIALFILLLVISDAYSQGCIMVRNIAGFGQYNLAENAFTVSDWQLNLVGRYFKAFRDFKGKEDINTPTQDQSIVRSYSVDMDLTRFMRNGWSVDVSIPVSANSRSATKEHGGVGTARHETNTFGIGDIRITVAKWLLSPSVSQKTNVQLGIGIKLPTGEFRYEDYFYKNDSVRVLAPVNGSIQLGDGGTGIITQLNTFYYFNKEFSLYGNFYYLINPRDQNGVSTLTGRLSGPTKTELITGNDVYSVPDIFSIRAGINLNVDRTNFSLGIRDEGVPVHDLIGNSNGLRRPGYNLSVEPGLLYRMERTSCYIYFPFIVTRRINQSLPDAHTSQLTGVYTVGSGGSGNCQVFLGVLFKL